MEVTAPSSIFSFVGIITLIFGLCAILGGFYAFSQKKFVLAVICGGACSVMAGFLALGAISLGLAGLAVGILPVIFIVKSRKEFTS